MSVFSSIISAICTLNLRNAMNYLYWDRNKEMPLFSFVLPIPSGAQYISIWCCNPSTSLSVLFLSKWNVLLVFLGAVNIFLVWLV